MFEHLPLEEWKGILDEVHRGTLSEFTLWSYHSLTPAPHPIFGTFLVLVPGGTFRLALPDYGAPALADSLRLGYDPDNELHLVLTTYESVMPLLLEGPWSHVVALERWQGGRFYSTHTWSGDEGSAAQGHVKRTPAHAASWVTGIGDQYKPDKDGNPRVTSLVFDLIK